MKRKIGLGLLFILTLIISVIIHLPAQIVLKQLPVPKQLKWESAQGTLWNGKLEGLEWQDWSVGDVEWQMMWSALLRGKAEVEIKAGKNSRQRLSAKGLIGASFNHFYMQNVFASIPAQEIAHQLSLPIPINAQGNVDLTLRQYEWGAPWCYSAQGVLAWSESQVNSSLIGLELELGHVFSELECSENQIVLKGEQRGQGLESDFDLQLMPDGKYQLQGFVLPKPGVSNSVRQQLSLLGKPDAEGRYVLNYSGKL